MSEPAIAQTLPTLEWVRPPLQERTRRSLEQMLDAAERLVAEKGFDQTGIAEIAAAAGASVGGFYRRFRDKQGLLQALHARFCDEARATADAALDPARWTGAATDAVVHEFIAFLLQIYRERAGLFRAYLAAGLSDATVRERTVALRAYLHDRLRALLATRRDDLTHPDPDLGAAMALDLVLGALSQAVQLAPDELGLDDPRLDRELSRAFLAYLGVRTP